MTNAEKFKEIFGFEVGLRCPFPIEIECASCEYGNAGDDCSTVFWNEEWGMPHKSTNIDKFKEIFGNLPVSLDTQKRLVIDDSNAPYGFWEQEYKKEEKK